MSWIVTAISCVGALARRPRGEVHVDVRPRPGERLAAELVVTAPPSARALRLRVSRPGHRTAEALVAVDEGGPRGIVRDGVTGLLRPADAQALADAVLTIVHAPERARAIAARARAGVGARTWAASLGRLADGYAEARRRHGSGAGAPGLERAA